MSYKHHINDDNYDKKCAVCGDRALGNNFEVLSCPSCKAFFRRNATKNKQYKCLFDNNCTIDITTRKYCKKCRLNKCYAMGMKKDWILLNEWKKGIKCGLQTNNNNTNTETISPNSSPIDEHYYSNPMDYENINPGVHYNNMTHAIPLDSPVPYGSDTSHDTDYSSPPLDYTISIYLGGCVDYVTTTTGAPIDIPDTFGDIDVDSDVEKEINDEIQDISAAIELQDSLFWVDRPLTDYRNNFNELEGNKLRELLAATQVFIELAHTTQHDKWLYHGHPDYKPSLLHQHMRRLNKMCHNLTAFNNICDADKICLLNYGSIDLFCIRSLPNYDYTRENWTFVMDKDTSLIVSLNVLQNMPRNAHKLCKNFFHTIAKEWDTDSVILDLVVHSQSYSTYLTAIIFFNPNRPNLKHKHMVNN
ncbi:unnamed protein product [Oppiella nova]|uniref:Nuclear receptor domain-containing protein n=1 Tax=Oppiella nova TaxID=334625 RepID=A0A7R9M2K5_9ACAR|nr:unnamed protein product [Oppiella nova]CAG2169596.1 unnamed protein product [Oppiella nova]